MSNRNRTFILLLAAALVLLAAVGAGAQSYTAGAYQAKAQGMGGDVSVEVVFDADHIQSVNVTAHNETPGIADPAIAQIPVSIVERQSLGVDAVAGASITSGAILSAVEDCVTQAGGDAEALKTAVEIEKEDADLTCDVVVVGGGVAGLSAAIEARDNGASVVLVEKMAATGGASALSGGECLAAGTEMQAKEGIEDSAQALADYWVMKGEGKINEEMVRSIAMMAPENIEWMQKNGVQFMDTMQTPTSMPWQNPRRTHKAANGAGTGFTEPLTESAKQKGVNILLSSPATGLIVEEGAVVGIEGTTATGGKLTVRAKNVILATGGYENNLALMEAYSPSIGNLPSHVGEAHAGDGLIWARELGSPIIAGDSGIVLTINYALITSADYDPYGIYMYVNANGERFMNEANYWFNRSRLLLDMPGRMYYVLADQKALASGARFEDAVAGGGGYKADTIEELAALTGINAQTLAGSVNQYNESCAAKEDALFGKDAEKLIALDTPPYYALPTTFNSNSGSFGGPQVDDGCRVVGAQGEIIPGLYAAGEVANGEIFYREYPCSGSAIQSYMAMGRIAGREAAK